MDTCLVVLICGGIPLLAYGLGYLMGRSHRAFVDRKGPTQADYHAGAA
jgi:hypothetical protein